jgi:polysaccharide deacetylase family protein (PEP-CTERM system associated)
MDNESKDIIMLNILTIDVEDYFQVAALATAFEYEDWSNQALRVESNTKRLLDLFDEAQIKATHFILGWVAERCPELVKEIHNRGHEVASHGYSHQFIYSQTPDVFREETHRSKAILEDIIGEPIYGYRAASYSITKQSLWALDILAEAGFTYDSSIFPIRHDRYGIPGTPTEPYMLQTHSGHQLIEMPLSTERVLGQTFPIAGGGYFRLYPYWFSRLIYRYRVKKKQPFIFYLHPWEIDPEQPKITNISTLSKFRHYNNLDVCETRLHKLLNEFQFGTMEAHIKQIDLEKLITIKINEVV